LKFKKGGVMKKSFVICIVMVLLSLFIMTQREASATEGGGGAYPNGAEDFMAGAVPPPGTYFLNYFTYYTADKLKIKDGSDIDDFDLNVTANTFRLLYVTKEQIFGGYWGMHVFVPILNVDVEMMGNSDSNFNLGDIIVDPFILSWHSKNWHFATGIDIFIPTGSSSDDRLANTSRNYWTFEPIFAFTYLSDGGFEVSSKFMYDFNTKNGDTEYTSGQEFHFDYLIGYQFKPWSIGLNGYYYKQITDDEIDGDSVADGFKGEVFAFGPAIKYDYKNMMFDLKYQHEVSVENKPEGEKFWVKFVYAF
jgi:hypothetical protein